MTINNRDTSIDFIKGVAIMAVILLHNMPNTYIVSIAWIGQAVPLFLLVSSYLIYRSFENGKTIQSFFSLKSISKILKRIFLPLLIMTFIQFVICNHFNNMPLFKVLVSGGIGPGSYYPWMYIQCWTLLPIVIIIVDSLSIRKSALFFILICIALEIISCVINIEPALYRLLFYRYLFLLYCGCILKKTNLKLSASLIYLAIISLIFSLIEVYGHVNFEPFFISQWKGYHWITSFYPSLLFILLIKLHNRLKGTFAVSFLSLLGLYSYEIFLCQMFVYSMFDLIDLSFIGNRYIAYTTYIVSTTLLSFVPILLYKLYLRKLIFKR